MQYRLKGGELRRIRVGVVFLLLGLCAGGVGIANGEEPQAVSFPSTDGVPLKGYLLGNGTTGVILAHMYPADQRSWLPFASKLAEKGFLVLTFDFRGYGESGGEKIVADIDKDLEGACLFLKPRVKQLFLVGASMGGTAGILVASRHKVAGVVSLSGPVAFRGLDAKAAVKKPGAPLLLIAGEQDGPAAAAARWFDKEGVSPRTLLMVPGPEHGTNLFDSPSGGKVETAILRFIDEHEQEKTALPR